MTMMQNQNIAKHAYFIAIDYYYYYNYNYS